MPGQDWFPPIPVQFGSYTMRHFPEEDRILPMLKTLFLPGAAGSAAFWKPVAAHAGLDGVFFRWPGLGNEPHQDDIQSIDDLIDMVAKHITEPVNIVAQSMGGFIAIRLALTFPHLVRRLVLTATSGGIPITDLGGSTWREDYVRAFPNAALWIAEPVPDLSAEIPTIGARTLLLWGDADPISPIPVGERLRALLPAARLHVFAGADHDLAVTHAALVAAEVRAHLAATP